MGFPTFLSKSTQDEALANTEDFTSNWVKINAFAIVAKCKQDSKVLRNLYKHLQAPKFIISVPIYQSLLPTALPPLTKL